MRYVLQVHNNRKTADEDDIAEILAEKVLQEQRYPRSEGYTLRHNVKLFRGRNRLQEIDHVVVKDAKVVGFGQTKNSALRSTLEKAEEQNSRTKRFIRNRNKIDRINGGNGDPMDISKFDMENIDEKNVFTVGADSKFDVVNFDENQVRAIFETFDGID